MHTNVPAYGGDFYSALKSGLTGARDVSIASGYISKGIVTEFESQFYAIAKRRRFRLLVGMAFYEGLTKALLDQLIDINSKLESFGFGNGIFICYTQRFHGKVYSIDKGAGSQIFVGSSNFSESGLYGNWECTVEVTDSHKKRKLSDYLDFIFEPGNSSNIDASNVPIRRARQTSTSIPDVNLRTLPRYDPTAISLKGKDCFEFDLSRVVTKNQLRSNVNCYFGKGRLNTSTGKITRRPWYEVELISRQDAIISNPIYPEGDFTAYTDDGYVIPMRTQGDGFKNMRSRERLTILGAWLKGKLESSGVLVPLTPITQNVLDAYGNDKIRFCKLSDDEYYMEFKPK